MLKEMQFVEVDKVEVAMNRLRLHEAEALRRNPKDYYVAFSGGKDSCVALDLPYTEVDAYFFSQEIQKTVQTQN